MPSKRQSKLASSRARDDVVTPQGPSSSVPRDPVHFPPDDPPPLPRSPSTYARPPPVEGERLLGKPEVVAKTGLSFVTIWRLMRRNAFPRSRQVLSSRSSRPRWLASEVDEWIASLPVRRLKGDGP